jgi:hypothetical protein
VWRSDPVWSFCRREEFFAPAGNAVPIAQHVASSRNSLSYPASILCEVGSGFVLIWLTETSRSKLVGPAVPRNNKWSFRTYRVLLCADHRLCHFLSDNGQHQTLLSARHLTPALSHSRRYVLPDPSVVRYVTPSPFYVHLIIGAFGVRTPNRGLWPLSPDLNPSDMLKCKVHSSNPRTDGRRKQHPGCSSAFCFASNGQRVCRT